MRKLSLDELGRMEPGQFKKAEKFPLVVILDNIRSMHNIGAVFRTCDAFRAEEIVLCGITATPPDREITKTALGATGTVKWQYEKDARVVVRNLKEEGYTVLAVEQCENALNLESYAPKQHKLAVVFGNEIKGVQQSVVDLCDDCLEIPQFGTKHSLNISVSAGIVIWDLFKKHKNIWKNW